MVPIALCARIDLKQPEAEFQSIILDFGSEFRIEPELLFHLGSGMIAGMKNRYVLFLIAELLVIALVPAIFRWIEPRLVAGMVAGSVFVALGLLIFISGLLRPEVRRSYSFVMGCVHLFVVALPMVTIRLLNSQSAFEDVRIWGLSGPVFHKLSTWVFMILLLATAVDIYRIWAKRKMETTKSI